MPEQKIKRYVVFVFPDYDALGGWRDFADSFDDPTEAKEFAKQWAEKDDMVHTNWHVWDYDKREVVCANYWGHCPAHPSATRRCSEDDEPGVLDCTGEKPFCDACE